jgi:hypothetical protein
MCVGGGVGGEIHYKQKCLPCIIKLTIMVVTCHHPFGFKLPFTHVMLNINMNVQSSRLHHFLDHFI